MSNWRDKVSESAVDFALNAFWVAVWGAVLTAALIAVTIWRGLPERWVWAVAASFLTFLLVLLSTAAIVWRARRHRPAKPSGRKGLLDFIRDRDRGLAAFNRNLTALSKHTERLGKKATKHTKRMESAKRIGWEWLVYRRALEAARSLEKTGQKMSIYAQRFSDSADLFIDNTNNWISWMQAAGSPVSGDSFLKIIQSLRAATASALPHIKGLRDASDRNRLLSSDLDLAGAHVVGALDQSIASMKRTIAFCDGILKQPMAPNP